MNPHVSTIRRWSALAAALLLVSVALAACGGGSDDGSDSSASSDTTTTQSSSGAYGGDDTSAADDAARSAAASKLALDARERGKDDFAFSQRRLTASAGTVTIVLDNYRDNKYPHAIAIEGNGVDKAGNVGQPSYKSTITVKLKPGTYTFYCPVGEHEKYGMKGTLTVQ